MIKAVIFDLNGVFVKGPKLSERFREIFEIPEEVFMPQLTGALAKMRLPDAGDSFAYWKPFLDKWHITLPPQLFWKFWFASEESVPEMVGLAESLRERGVKVFILSNNFAERTQYYARQFPFLHCVPNGLYYSWQTGFLKSDPRAYKKVLEDNALKPEEVLFFDDSEEHVRIAKELGISAHLFQDIRGAREALKRHGLC